MNNENFMYCPRAAYGNRFRDDFLLFRAWPMLATKELAKTCDKKFNWGLSMR